MGNGSKMGGRKGNLPSTPSTKASAEGNSRNVASSDSVALGNSRVALGNSRGAALSDLDEPLVVHERPLEVRTVITCAIDDIALAALRDHRAERVHCAICEDLIEGEVPCTGLMMWTRGDDVRYDEPPLCGPCASSISVSAWTRWQQLSD